jgi:predicted dehydrogenase
MAKLGRPLRVAVIGLGFGQQVHVPAFRADSRCEVTTLCGSTHEKAVDIAGRLNVPHASGEWRSVVADPKIDAVSIAVPPHLQPRMALEALQHGKAVFCEKPLAAHVHDALPLRKAVRQDLPNMVNFEFCECDGWQSLQTALRSHGDITLVDVDWRVRTYANQHRLENWKSRPEQGGGALQAFVAHTFYLLEQLKGPISRLVAKLNKETDDPRAGETEVTIEAQFLQGGQAKIHVATDAAPPHRHQIDLVGPQSVVGTRLLRLLNEGSDYIDGFQLFRASHDCAKMMPVSSSSPEQPASTPPAAGPATDGRTKATSRLVRKFVDWAFGGAPAHPNFADGYRVQFLIEAARRSNAEGRWMDALE